jgi:DNA invertase Pin-like site-specific DNA recombinase
VIAGHGSMIDTTRPEGRMLFGMLAVLAEFERELISERTKAGMKAARKRGARIGRPPKLNPRQITIAKKKIASGHSRVQVARRLGVSVGTLRAGITRSASQKSQADSKWIKAIRTKKSRGRLPVIVRLCSGAVGGEPAVDRLPWRQVVWQQPPRASRSHHVEYPI